jgi:hypothetical protein
MNRRTRISWEVLQLSNIKSRIRFAAKAGAILTVLGASILGSRPAAATPATLGFYPSTDIYGDKSFHLDVDSYRPNNFGGEGFDTFGITYGIGDKDKAFGRTEIGFDHILNSNGAIASNKFKDHILLNAKTQIYNNADSGIRAVAGVWLLGSRQAGAANVGYVLGSKSFKWGRVHAGVAHAFRDQGAASDTFIQLGYDKVLTKKISFAADFYSGRGPLSGIQPTLYYAVNDKASFGIGYFINRELAGAGDNDQLYLCFDYNFGGPSAP